MPHPVQEKGQVFKLIRYHCYEGIYIKFEFIYKKHTHKTMVARSLGLMLLLC